jgi:hypothetical protein
MAAISHVFTIRRAAQIWVYDIDGAETPASPTMASRLFAKLSRIRAG